MRRKFVFFTDDNLFNDAARLNELMRAMVPLRLRWSCQASIDVAADESLVRLMAASGCISVTIGLETLDADNLR